MKNRFLAVVMAAFIALPVGAQDEFSGATTWSMLFPVSKKVASPDIIGQDGDYIYLSRYIKGDRYIEKYNLSTLALEKAVEANLEYKEKELSLIGQFMFDGKPTLLTSFYNKKTNRNYVFLQTIDPSTLALSTPMNIGQNAGFTGAGSGLMSLYGANMASYYALAFGADFVLSEDGTLGYVLMPDITEATTDDAIKDGNYDYKASIYSGTEGEPESSVVKFPEDFISVETQVGNDGTVYILGYALVKDLDEKKKLFESQKMKMDAVRMLILDVKTGEYETLPVEVDGRDIEMLTFDLAEDGSINVAGLLSAEGTGVNGSFITRFDASLNDLGTTITDFETDFITTGWSEKKKEDMEKKQDKGKSEPQLYNYYIDYLVTKPDGSVLMLAEQYYVRVVTRTYTNAQGGTTTTTTYYYYYNDIIAINYDKQGELEWKKVLPKKQMSVNDGGYYLSYFMVREGNDIHLIYNDSEANYVDTEGMSNSELKAMKRSTIGAMVTLDENGEVSKQKLFEFEEGGLKLVPKICSEAGDGLVFLYARSPKGDKVGVINFDK
jgi:hypothetical protein